VARGKYSIRKEIELLDSKRKELGEENNQYLPFLFVFPFIASFIFYVATLDIPATILATLLSTIISLFVIKYLIEKKFKQLKAKVKETFVSKFMHSYYPGIEYKYSSKEDRIHKVLYRMHLDSAPNKKEEDVITGTYKGAEFYFSEIQFTDEQADDSVFKGILFELKFPAKRFPKTRIISNRKISQKLFSNFKEDKEHSLWYETKDASKMRNLLQPVLPFIAHLKRHQGDIRFHAEGSKFSILMQSNMNFLDTPAMLLHKTFDNEKHQKNISKQLHTLFFIIDAFTHDMEKNEIKEKLELKALEPITLRINSKEDDLNT